MIISIREERAADVDSISRLTEAAFQSARHSSHTEHFIVNALRRSHQLTVSLVAVDGDAIVGHIAISPVTISSGATGWYGLGPLSVLPSRQGQGVGSRLTEAALAELRRVGGVGCVVLGDPGYYGRFGFMAHRGLELPGASPEYFLVMSFGPGLPTGRVRYHDGFRATV